MDDKKVIENAISIRNEEESIFHQMVTLRDIAKKNGLTNAANLITSMYDMKDRYEYGCHCDLEDGMEPDKCVIDISVRTDCLFAQKIEKKENCPYWRVIIS